MTISLVATATSATTARLDISAVNSGATGLQIQYGLREDFIYTLAPIVPVAVAAAIDVAGLNQVAQYYYRIREAYADGTTAGWSNIAAAYQPIAAAQVTTPGLVMIEPALIMLPVTVLNWTSPQEIAGHPARLLDIDSPVAQWWASGGPSYGFEMEHGGSPIDTIALLGTNAPDNATITIKAGSSLANVRGGAPEYSTVTRAFRASANLPGRDGYHGYVRLPAPVTYKFWRVEIGNGAPLNCFVATHALMGLARVTKNFSQDKSEAPLDQGSFERTRGGDPDRVVGFRARRVAFELSVMTEAQYETQYGDLIKKTNSRAFIVPNTKSGAFLHDRLLYGRLNGGKATNPVSPRFTVEWSIDSII